MAPLKKPAKLAKLKIQAYSPRRSRASDLVGTFVAMFNPGSWSRAYAIEYAGPQAQNSTGKKLNFIYSVPSELKVTLLLDGAGVDESTVNDETGGQKVSDRIKRFLNLTFQMNGKIHEPNYLSVKWGDLNFHCRL